MARANTIQTNFTAGEIAPAMYGRTDINKYLNGARKLRNMIVFPQGGAYRRPGTRYVASVKTPASATILKRFVFSETQPYILEFGDLYIRVYFDGAAVAMSDITTSYVAADLAALSFTQSADVIYIAHPNYQTRTLTRTSHTVWAFGYYTSEDGPWLDEDSVIKMTISSVTERVLLSASSSLFVLGDVGKYVEWREGEKWQLGLITAYSSALVVTVQPVPVFHAPTDTFLHFDAPHVKSKDTAGGAAVPAFTPDTLHKFVRVNDALGGKGPEPTAKWYKITDYVDSIKVKGTVQTEVTYTWPTTRVRQSQAYSRATLTVSTATFVSSDQGRHIRLRFGNQWRWFEILTYTSSTVVEITRLNNNDTPLEFFPRDPNDADQYYNAGIATSYRLGAWSTVTGWPAVVTFHQQRLCFGRNTGRATTVWMTETADYVSHAPTTLDGLVLDTSAIAITLVSTDVNEIQWMQSGPVLLVGTTGSEWQIKPTSVAAAVTPTNIAATSQTAFGSPGGDVVERIGHQILHVQLGGRKVRAMQYDFNIDAFTSQDISIISSHIGDTYGKIIQSAVQKTPHPVLWLVTASGYLIGVTYERDQEVVAWHVHSIGGSGLVEWVEVVPSISGAGDDVYLIVKRTISAATARYIERLDRTIAPTLAADNQYLDSFLSLDNGSSINTGNVTGLSHLNGETVGITVDGVYVGTGVPSGGSLWVGYKGRKISVGYVTEAYVSLLDPEGGSQAGTSQGKKKRITESVARVVTTPPYFKVASADGYTNVTENLMAIGDPTSAEYKRIVPDLTINTKADSGSPPATYPDPTTAAGLLEITNRTGDVVFSDDDPFDNGGRIMLVQDEPYPLNLLMIAHKLNTNE